MPKVNKLVLILIAGVLWSSIGILLIKIASRWFNILNNNELIVAIIMGVTLGAAIAYFGFSNLAKKNIKRIDEYDDKVCLWAFQKWQSYLLIAFMISLGIFMRKTTLIPKPFLIPMYIGIGSALFLSSFRYYIFLFKNREFSYFFKLKRINLVLFTGFIWLFAGLILLFRAYSWVNLFTTKQLYLYIIIALLLAVIKISLIFYKLTIKNISRIINSNETYIFIYKFHVIKDKVLIVAMILIGTILRHSPYIPKKILMPVYLGIGLAMVFSFSVYMRYFIKNITKKS